MPVTKIVKKRYVTKSQTGLVITRKDNKLTASWVFGDKDYGGGQRLKYRINGGAWVNVSIGATTKSKHFLTLNWSNYYPNAGKPLLKTIEVSLKGCRAPWYKDKTKSGKTTRTVYVTYTSDEVFYTYKFAPPSVPTVTATRADDVENVCTYAWSAANPSDKGNVLTRTEYKFFLLKNSNQTDGAKAEKETKIQSTSGTGGASGSIATPETYTPSGETAYTRWIGVRSVGPCGVSAYAYARCVYSIPYVANSVSASASDQTYGGYVCNAKWTSPSSVSHPIDHTDIQYAFAIPEAGMQCPDGASWQTAATKKDTALKTVGYSDSVSFPVDSSAGADQCMFVRVNNVFVTKTAYGTPVVVSGGVGALKNPDNVSVTTDQTTYRATITASNTSDVDDSFLVVKYMTEADPNGFVIGIIPSGSSSVTVQCPEWSAGDQIRFGVYACVGSYRQTVRGDGVTSYAVTPRMKSGLVTQGGTVPAAPATVVLSKTDIPGTIRVEFDWTWSEATKAEISWADHADAWESTDEPSDYEIPNTHASVWNISGLETGVKWYVRVRLAAGDGDGKTYGAYSDIYEIDLTSAPSIPVLTLSAPVITEDGSVTASWVFVSTDGTAQASAEVAEVITSGNDTVYVPLAHTATAQYVEINAAEAGWSSGETHLLAVRVTSASGRMSDDWSDLASVAVADPLVCAISQASLEDQTVITDTVSRDIKVLTEMPLTVTVTGAGADGITNVIIERSEPYDIARPDESTLIGYTGETIALYSQTGEAQITIDKDMLIGSFDDGAAYRIIATVQDALGQSDYDALEFEVHWDHQAIIPDAEVEIDEEEMIAILMPVAPEGAAESDVCDIYRLSADKPQLIYPNATWGTQYVDPYPAIGEYGGHRFVFKTANGDYITDDNELAWTDLRADDDDVLETGYNIIDFDGGRVLLRWNVELSNNWKKDFQETQYLGGSVQGDWNPAVHRESDISSVHVVGEDEGMIEALRRLATYTGICHVRTKDGSSYAADVQVQEKYSVSEAHRLANFTLKITRVDSEAYEGMTLEEWRKTHPAEEQEG